MKKMYLVKREVIATSITKAMTTRGRVYEICVADDKFQPEQTKKIGFKLKTKTK